MASSNARSASQLPLSAPPTGVFAATVRQQAMARAQVALGPAGAVPVVEAAGLALADAVAAGLEDAAPVLRGAAPAGLPVVGAALGAVGTAEATGAAVGSGTGAGTGSAGIALGTSGNALADGKPSSAVRVARTKK